jgi:hypothetical protein
MIHCMVLPYLKGFDIIKCGFFYLDLSGSIVYLVFVVIIFVDLFRFLKIGIIALSLADIMCKYFLFLQIFFFGEEKRGPRHSQFFLYIYMQNL